MRSGSSELLLEQQQQELRLRKKRELAPKKKNDKRRFRSWRERVRFYTTSTLVLITVASGSSLLFLVPLYVDPALSTLAHNFVENPTLCTTVRRENLVGLFNCSWSSCREGCTSDMYKCTNIYVTYIENITLPKNLTELSTLSPLPYPYISPDLTTNIALNSNFYNNFTTINEQSEESTLWVNIKGCGYPPTVTCKDFNDYYGMEGALFPCYYSRKNKTIVLTSYDHDEQIEVIIHYFFVPFVICFVTGVSLCIMHCDCTCRPDTSYLRHRVPLRRQRVENLR